MAFITFITPYKPIICGIADYADFIVRESPPHSCDVVTFNLDNYGVPLHNERVSFTSPVWYGIPSRDDFSASSILEGLAPHRDQVLWFQHEFGIWPDSARFVDMLKSLRQVKVVSLHTLHFQSRETPYGLRREEYAFLRLLLPHTDAITVFSNGVYEAVTSAFPKYAYKVHVLRHGTHLCPRVAGMSRSQAKVRIHEFLLNESDLDQRGKGKLRQEGVLLEPDATIIGAAGFITASKRSELLFQACDRLRRMLPQREIVAVRAGMLRTGDNGIDSKYAANLRTRCNGEGQYFLETYLPEDTLHVLLRALDVYFYWPSDCTQSGVLAHALGAGAVIVCRDMEGVGETVRLAGGLACADFEEAIIGLRELVLDPELGNKMSERAMRYAAQYSWRNQALQHFDLAEQLCRSRVDRVVVPVLPLMRDPRLTEALPLAVSGNTAVAC